MISKALRERSEAFRMPVAEPITCWYVNQTRQLQVIRMGDIPGQSWERVVFPKQRLLFHALPDACLEVYGSESGQPIFIEQLLCSQLKCVESFQWPQAPTRVVAEIV